MTKTVKAEVKSLHVLLGNPWSSEPTAEPIGSLDAFNPSNRDHFGFTVQVFIGTDTEDLAGSFDLVVCSPSWFADQAKESTWIWEMWVMSDPLKSPETVVYGRHFWFMRRWDRASFEAALNAVCANASPGPDWGTVASRIGRVIPWEFNYRYDKHVSEHYGEPYPPAL